MNGNITKNLRNHNNMARVSDPVWYWPDPHTDPTSQDKPDPDPDPDTSVLKIFHLFYEF